MGMLGPALGIFARKTSKKTGGEFTSMYTLTRHVSFSAGKKHKKNLASKPRPRPPTRPTYRLLRLHTNANEQRDLHF